MAAITATIVGRDAVLARFRMRREKIVEAVRATMLAEMSKLANYVKASKLSGQVLKNRTGTLRRSIHAGAEATGETVTGTVGTNVSYAHVHEDGGAFQIPAHQRQLTMVFGRPIEPRFITVAAHVARYPQRAFLRPAFDERRPSILAALRKSVETTMAAP
jgi:phage gpG-like protein